MRQNGCCSSHDSVSDKYKEYQEKPVKNNRQENWAFESSLLFPQPLSMTQQKPWCIRSDICCSTSCRSDWRVCVDGRLMSFNSKINDMISWQVITIRLKQESWRREQWVIFGIPRLGTSIMDLDIPCVHIVFACVMVLWWTMVFIKRWRSMQVSIQSLFLLSFVSIHLLIIIL